MRPSQPFWWREIDRVTDLVQAELGRAVAGLGCLWSDRDDERRLCRGIFQFEARAEAVLAEGRWVGSEELAHHWLADGTHDKFARTCLEELETSAGTVYMKASCFLPTQVDEPRLTALLGCGRSRRSRPGFGHLGTAQAR